MKDLKNLEIKSAQSKVEKSVAERIKERDLDEAAKNGEIALGKKMDLDLLPVESKKRLDSYKKARKEFKGKKYTYRFDFKKKDNKWEIFSLAEY